MGDSNSAGDIYRDLAAKVADHAEEDVSAGERERAKEAFWEAFAAVVELPGNEDLLEAVHGLRAVRGEGLKFADFAWPSRWNKGEQVAALSQSGADVMATGFFGVLRFRLDKPDDVAAIVNHARRFADMVERAGQVYGAADAGG